MSPPHKVIRFWSHFVLVYMVIGAIHWQSPSSQIMILMMVVFQARTFKFCTVITLNWHAIITDPSFTVLLFWMPLFGSCWRVFQQLSLTNNYLNLGQILTCGQLHPRKQTYVRFNQIHTFSFKENTFENCCLQTGRRFIQTSVFSNGPHITTQCKLYVSIAPLTKKPMWPKIGWLSGC